MTVGRRFDEHHGRQVVEVPAGRDFDQVRFLPAFQRPHPGARVLGVIDLRPAISDANVVRLEIVVHQAVVVFETALEQELVGDGTEFPPGSDVPGRPPPRQLLRHVDALVEDRLLLRAGHRDGILVGVSVDADLMTGRHHHSDLFGKGLHGVTRHEPRCFDAEPLEQLHQPRRPHFARKHPARDVEGRIGSAVGSKPARDSVHVDAKRTQDLLGHNMLLLVSGDVVQASSPAANTVPLRFERQRPNARGGSGRVAGQ